MGQTESHAESHSHQSYLADDKRCNAAIRLSAAYRGHSARSSVQWDSGERTRQSTVAAGIAPFVQAAGHAGMFLKRPDGIVVKTATKREQVAIESLQGTSLQRFLPAFHGADEYESVTRIFLEDVTAGMRRPAVMDIKMGMRTFVESEVIVCTSAHDSLTQSQGHGSVSELWLLGLCITLLDARSPCGRILQEVSGDLYPHGVDEQRKPISQRSPRPYATVTLLCVYASGCSRDGIP